MSGGPVTRATAAADGVDGRRAWVVAFTVAVTAALGFGTSYSFGAFFDDMAAEFDAGRSATAMVFAITTFLFFGVGIVSGRWCDRYGPRRLLVAAALIMGGGLLATSQVTSLWMGYLTYGVGVGFGAGLYITPGFAVVGAWFDRQRAVALGVASAGSGLGTLVLVPVATALIDAYGWRTTYLVLGVVATVVLLVASRLVARPPVPMVAPAGGAPRASTTPAFRLLFASNLLMSLALFTAFAFVVPFAKDDGIGSGPAALLLSVVGASSFAGRVGLSSLVRRLGALRLYQATLAVQPVAYVVWVVAGGNYALLALFAALLGVSYGGYVALGPTVAAHLFGVVGLGGVLGTLFFGSAIGGLVGPPLAGWLADATEGHLVPIAVSFAATAGAAVLTLAVRDAPDAAPPPEGGCAEALTP